jgi:hypothetical protein
MARSSLSSVSLSTLALCVPVSRARLSSVFGVVDVSRYVSDLTIGDGLTLGALQAQLVLDDNYQALVGATAEAVIVGRSVVRRQRV